MQEEKTKECAHNFPQYCVNTNDGIKRIKIQEDVEQCLMIIVNLWHKTRSIKSLHLNVMLLKSLGDNNIIAVLWDNNYSLIHERISNLRFRIIFLTFFPTIRFDLIPGLHKLCWFCSSTSVHLSSCFKFTKFFLRSRLSLPVVVLTHYNPAQKSHF